MSIIVFNSEIGNKWPYFIFLIIKYNLFSLEDAINKLLLTDKFLLPQHLIFYKGILNFLMYLILFLILYLSTNESIFDFNFFWNHFISTNDLIAKLVIIIFSIPRGYFMMIIIYLFSITHVAFLNNVISLYTLIKCKLDVYSGYIIYEIIDIISFILVIIGTLIFNELIIINCYDLNKYTKITFLNKEKADNQEIDSTILLNDKSIINNKEDNKEENDS